MNCLTIILYIIATICFTNTFAASTVKPIPNPHMSSNNGQCLCTAQALQAKNTIVSPTQLQPDTFLSMEKVKIAEFTVPIYQFKQPERISSLQLPFKIVLQSSLPNLNEVIDIEVDDKQGLDSWFVNYRWSILICSDCNGKNTHIGWRFQPVSGKNNNDFYALIVKTGDDNNGIFSGMSLEAFKNMVQIGLPAPKWMLGLIATKVVQTTGL